MSVNESKDPLKLAEQKIRESHRILIEEERRKRRAKMISEKRQILHASTRDEVEELNVIDLSDLVQANSTKSGAFDSKTEDEKDQFVYDYFLCQKKGHMIYEPFKPKEQIENEYVDPLETGFANENCSNGRMSLDS